MDIKRKIFDEIIFRYNTMYAFEKIAIEKTAQLIKECILDGGVIQVCGVGHAEEFVNELNYRAGGIAPVHALCVDELFIRNIITEEEKENFFDYNKNVDYFESFYEINDKDMYILVSLSAKEPVLLELAKRAKSRGQKVIVVCNKTNLELKKIEETILDYNDLMLDICASEDDSLIYLGDTQIGQSWTTIGNVMAQMITAEVYRLYNESGKKCPILLSANLKGADIHNNSLTDPYGRRVM